MLKYLSSFGKWQWLLSLLGLFIVVKVGMWAIGIALIGAILVCVISAWDSIKSSVRALLGRD